MEAALHAGSFLAAERHQPLSENSRLGHQLPTVALHPGIGFVNSNTATGLRVCLYDDGRGSRCTGKERDAESGLDYFGARYYGSALGRFTSPDEFKGGFDNLDGTPAFGPGPIAYADLSDPQTLNMYVYTRNNPLRYADPDGHGIWDLVNGVANAFGSDNLGGAGRLNVNNSDFRAGQAIGDGIATITGTAEVLFGGGEAVATSPAALAVAGAVVPAAGVGVAAHGLVAAGTGLKNLVKSASDNVTEKRAGDFKSSTREGAIKQNADASGGANKCTNCGQDVVRVKNEKGQAPPGNQLQVHHDPRLAKVEESTPALSFFVETAIKKCIIHRSI